MDRRAPTAQEAIWCEEQAISWVVQQPENVELFWKNHDWIVASPGIDIRRWAASYPEKVLGELDLFAQAFERRHKPADIIAITGTVGKTTITHLCGELLRAQGKNVFVGGNIGVGMLDAVDNEDIETFVLEVSSFQLEYMRSFRPSIAIWTNLFENHLDRHGTLEGYRAAKARLFAQQRAGDCAILPTELIPALGNYQGEIIPDGYPVPLSEIPAYSYQSNWFIIAALAWRMGIDPFAALRMLAAAKLPDHRCTPIATINGVTYYDDSKATVIEATRAALAAIPAQRIVLLFGGVSKGVDRASLLHTLPLARTVIVPFGGEAKMLHTACVGLGLAVLAPCATLEDAVAIAHAHAKSGDAVLLSPGGASFDLFKDYGARGLRFREIVDSIRGSCDTVGA